MTEHNNTNAGDERTNPMPDDGTSHGDGPRTGAGAADGANGGRTGGMSASNADGGKNEKENAQTDGSPADLGNLDAAWAAFEAEHRDDLNDVASSRNAKRFRKHAERKEKETLLNVKDLNPDAFSRTGASHGPRDFTGSSWLDADDVMDRYGDDFTPPDPDLGPVAWSKLVFWILLVGGIAGVIGSVFVPALTGILGTLFGVCVLIGGAGLIAQHKGHSQTRTDPFDDGARV